MKLKGYRKFIVAILSLAVLAFVPKVSGEVFVWAFAALISAYMTGNSLEWFSNRTKG